jgi:cation diffusion facilitator CzcD-associated flavoprotein CzcO
VSAATEHLDVLVVGAGLSGIGAGHYIQTECPWATYAIFEARGAIGGTWDLFRYPGLRSDSDMFTLGYSFRPWDGKKAIADGDTILQYIKDTAAEEGIDQKIRFHHKLLAADWSTPDGHYKVTAERTDPATGATELVHLTAGFIYSCTGYYRYDKGYQPDFPGMASFEGTIIHPQFWPEDLDITGKRVVVIGSGATAITLIPSLAANAAHVTMLQRSPTYIASLPAVDPLANAMRKVLPDSVSGPALRWVRAMLTQGSYHLSKRRPGLVKAVLRRQVKAQLPKGYDIDTHFTPTYNPWDQRLCLDADGGLFKAIRAGKASVVTDHVDAFTPQGIALQSGEKIEADIIVTATGLELLFIGGAEITVDGEAGDPSERLVYKGTMIEGVPNFAVGLGYTNASWTLKVDLSSDFVTRLLNRMRNDGLRQCTPVNNDPTVEHAPLFGLNSGYINRAADQLPKQGTKFPWQVYQSYLKDFRALKLSSLDEAMEFSNPVPAKRPTAKV